MHLCLFQNIVEDFEACVSEILILCAVAFGESVDSVFLFYSEWRNLLKAKHLSEETL